MSESEESSSFSNSIDRLKESFLLATAKGGNVQDCEALLSIGADVNWRGQDNETPLLAACRKGHSDTVQLLLAYGAECDAKGGDSCTALHIAARRGDLNTVNILLNGRANVNAKTADGKTAYDIAKAYAFDDVCQRIVSHRHNPSAPSLAASASRQSLEEPSESKRSHGDGLGLDRAGSSSGVRRAEQKPSSGSVSLEAASKAVHSPSREQDSRPAHKSVASATSDTPKQHQTHTHTHSGTGAGAAAEGSGGPMRATSVAAPKDYSFAPAAVVSSRTNKIVAATPVSSKGPTSSSTTPSKSASGAAGVMTAEAQAEQANYIYELQASLEMKSSEAEALRLQLEEEMIAAHVAQKEGQALKEQLLEMKEHILELAEELALLRGEPEGLREITTVGECAKVERYLKASLARIEEHKASLINKIVSDNLEDSRLCVVCQTSEKSVVLLPCRHVCLCKDCASNDLVVDCPLCREHIRDRITVFM
jgi:hypothetical protein